MLIQLLILLVIVAVIVAVIRLIELPENWKQIIYVVLGGIVVIYLIKLLLMGGSIVIP